jgi:hypothetical protein
MGFNKLILPELESLKRQLANLGDEQFTQHWARRFANSDAFIGSEDSMQFIKQFIEK